MNRTPSIHPFGLRYRSSFASARIRLVRLRPQFLASRQIVIDRLVKRNPRLIHRRTMKTHDISNAHNVTNEASVLFAVLDAGCVAFVDRRVQGWITCAGLLGQEILPLLSSPESAATKSGAVA